MSTCGLLQETWFRPKGGPEAWVSEESASMIETSKPVW